MFRYFIQYDDGLTNGRWFTCYAVDSEEAVAKFEEEYPPHLGFTPLHIYKGIKE